MVFFHWVWYVGFAIYWTSNSSTTTGWRSADSSDTSNYSTTNAYCTGDGFTHSHTIIFSQFESSGKQTANNYFFTKSIKSVNFHPSVDLWYRVSLTVIKHIQVWFNFMHRSSFGPLTLCKILLQLLKAIM